MKAERIDHVTIYARDLDKATKFFSELFELNFSEPFGPKTEDVVEVMDILGVNLMAPKTKDGPMSRTVERKGEGLAGLTFKVPDIDAAVAEMKSRGIRLIGRGNYGPRAKWAMFHPKDTYNVMINLVEYHAAHPYMTCMDESQK